MSTADAKKVVQRLFDAFNADRFDEWDDLLAPDLTLNGREITADDYRAFARGGRIHDAFDVWDWLGQMVQLGLWPPAGHTI